MINLKKMIIFLLLSAIIIPFNVYAINNQTTFGKYFDDLNFYTCIIENYNKENSGSYNNKDILSDEQLDLIVNLNCDNNDKDYQSKIKSTNGIEKISNLKKLNLYGNDIEKIDLSNNKNLYEIQLTNNSIYDIDLSNNINLKSITMVANGIEKIDLSKNINLTSLSLAQNSINEIDLSNNINLEWLNLSNNILNSVNVSNNLEIETLYITDNTLKTIDLANNKKITDLDLANNKLNEIIFPDDIKLKNTSLYNNKLGTKYKTCHNSKKCKFGKIVKINNNNEKYSLNVEKGTIINNILDSIKIDEDTNINLLQNQQEDIKQTKQNIEIKNNYDYKIVYFIVPLIISLVINVFLLLKIKKKK